MPLKLVGAGDIYEIKYPISGLLEADWPVFVMRKLTIGQIADINDQSIRTDGSGKDAKIVFRSGTASRLKIEAAIVDWRNIVDEKGNPAPCNNSTKSALPAELQGFLESSIDETNRLLGGVTEEERKN